jgi:hypothetical protein
MIRSPVIMRGIYGSRSPGMRGAAIRQYGGNVGLTEGAVLRALRWLKKYQEADGSWNQASGAVQVGGDTKTGAPAAMTGFGLLTFLAHGETPASEEFGETVRRAIQWLLDNQSGEGSWRRHYEHQIAAYALAEAFALTRIPMLKPAAERAMDIIIRGQNPSGGWNYPLRPMDRDDTSVMAWCAQALKAAKMAGLDNQGLDECMKKAIEGFRKNADPNGGFGYSSTGPAFGQLRASGLTGAGTLSMQFLGAAKLKETKAGIAYLQERRNAFDWSGANWKSLYYWYYDTQARFHAGGSIWKDWNRMFARPLVQAQTILRGKGVDGKDIGYWSTTDDREGVVMNTCLAAMMLQVYYRYLPTFKTPEASVQAEEEASDAELDVDITI